MKGKWCALIALSSPETKSAANVQPRFFAVVTARSSKKGQAIIDSLDQQHRSNVDFAVVEDVGQDGIFDQVINFGGRDSNRVMWCSG